MRLVTFDAGTGPMAGVLQEDRVVDAAEVLGVRSGLRDVQALLELPDRPLDRLKSALVNAAAGRPLSEVRLLSPILRPPTIRDFMVYEGHASGGGTRKLPEAWYRLPVFYFSNTLRIFGPDADIPFPSATERLDYELEIGLVIAREGSDINGSDWLQYAAGFTIFNDWSCRDLQSDEMQVGLGPAKGKDAASSLGPCVVTLDELGASVREGRLHGRCSVKVNGELWMENNAGTAYHDWGAILERAARDSRLVPGDVLGSGTVSGGTIGEAIRNGYRARYLQPADTVEMEVEGIGVLRNRLVPPVLSDPAYRFKAKPVST